MGRTILMTQPVSSRAEAADQADDQFGKSLSEIRHAGEWLVGSDHKAFAATAGEA